MAEITVTTTADSGAGSLRQAILDAQDGDVIQFDATVFPSGTTTAILFSSTLNVPKNIEINGDGRVALDGQSAIRVCSPSSSSGNAAHLKGVTIRHGAYSSGAGVILQYGQPILTDCIIEDCNATSAGGGVYFVGGVDATLNNCTIRNCTADAHGGGGYFSNTSQATLNDCVITNCTAGTNGGGLAIGNGTSCALNRCSVTGCVATGENGGGVYAYTSGAFTLSGCTIRDNTSADTRRRGVTALASVTFSCADTNVDALFLSLSDAAAKVFSGSISTVEYLYLAANLGSVPTVTFLAGAALAVTASASIPTGATFTSETRGYLAVVPGVNTNNATFNNVVLCDYNPDKTYYYVGGAEGSFADPADWSLSKGGTALRYSPIADGYVFVVETGENDVAIAKGSETFSGATVVLSGPTAVSATVDVATFDVEAFTGSLVLTGAVAITGDASTLDVTVSGTLRVAGNQKISTLTLVEDSNVVFAAADDILAVTTLATLNNATVACPYPVAFFSTPEGTDGTAATFNNVVFSVGAGAGVTDVTGVKAGKNYTINIFSTDNTKPVVVEYKGAEDSEWTVADDSFVGSNYTMKSDDVLTFRVYDGENFTTATIKNYGVYNAARDVVVGGYLETSSQAGYVN